MSKTEAYVGIVRRAMVAAAATSSAVEIGRMVRRGRGLLAGFARLRGSEADAEMERFAARIAFFAGESESWISAERIAAGDPGPFDTLDLPSWLAVARHAGVPAIPAREVLRLSEEEVGHLAGRVELSSAVGRRIAERAAALAARHGIDGEGASERGEVDGEALEERLLAAMDELPEGYMVRTARCGGGRLKALAGAGVAGPEAPEVRFGPALTAGPGWTRVGNRRRLDAVDDRILEAYASQFFDGEVVYLARPWVAPAAMVRCADPHRASTPIRGPGWWPLEVRVFVTGGRVTGASSYYPWLEVEATPATARLMLDARAMTERLVETCRRRGLVPRCMDNEKARLDLDEDPATAGNAPFAELLARQGRDEVSFTADFLLADLGGGRSGLVLLECGPPAGAAGGAHIVGFCGVYGPPLRGAAHLCEGVAYRQMAHVDMLDPRTWVPGDVTGRITSWEEAEALAGGETVAAPEDGGAEGGEGRIG